MRESFGELILKKDSILYCKSNDDYEIMIEKQKKNINIFLHNLYFHPSQFNGSINLFKITLKKDISLFCEFKINNQNNHKFTIISLIKYCKNCEELYNIYDIKLKEHNFDGFITPQYGYAKNFEISLFNNDSIFKIEKLENIENWNNIDILKYCGNFPVCFTYIKPILNLNRSYQTKINSCIDYYKNNNELKHKSNGFFYLIFIYSDIYYHDFEQKNISDLLLNKR